MTYRPLIAIPSYHLAEDRVARWPHGGYGVPASYVEALHRAGARTALLAPGGGGEFDEILLSFDGLLLIGGGDVDPARYRQAPGEHTYGIEPDRDELEIGLVLAADRLGVPTLCICRGMQVMNVAFGGTLHQHLPDLPGLIEHGVPVANTVTTHDVDVAAGSKLLATTAEHHLSCSSHHHQGIDRLGEGLVATGRSEDGLVEAIELIGGRATTRWMLGVEWHPEETADHDPAQQSLFEALTDLARWRGTQALPGVREGRTREIAVVEYDPSWPSKFEREARRIREALGELALRIDHVGSTSVPGLGAKPTIDIQVSVTSMQPRAPYADPLVRLGYTPGVDPHDPDHMVFSRDEGGERAYHVHVTRAGSDAERDHLAFRDRLREHPETAAEYERLKRKLVVRHPHDVYAYVDGKTQFVEAVLRELRRRVDPGQELATKG